MAAIVIVGGGVSGLGCAWQLKRAGHDVEVLEKADTLGGRAQSEVRGQIVLEVGAQHVHSGDGNLRWVASALGVGSALRTPGAACGQGVDAVLRGVRFVGCDTRGPRAFSSSPLLSTGAKLRLAGLPLELFRRRKVLDCSRPERAASLDGEGAPSLLARIAGEEARDYLLAPLLASRLACDPARMSGAFALLALQSLARGSRPQSFQGGVGRFAGALAHGIPVRRGCEVFSVETHTDGARVRYRISGRERSVVADAVVVAVAGSRVSTLCPKLTPAEQAFFASVDYAPAATVHLTLERPPRELPAGAYAVGFPAPAGIPLHALYQAHLRPGAAPEGAGFLVAQLAESEAERCSEAPDAEVVAHVLELLARTPLGRLTPMHTVVTRRSEALPRFPRGYLVRLAAFTERLERSPRLAFAGDYLAAPSLEGALTSGLRAASQVLR